MFVLIGYGIYFNSKRYNFNMLSLLDEIYSISTQNKQISTMYFVRKSINLCYMFNWWYLKRNYLSPYLYFFPNLFIKWLFSLFSNVFCCNYVNKGTPVFDGHTRIRLISLKLNFAAVHIDLMIVYYLSTYISQWHCRLQQSLGINRSYMKNRNRVAEMVERWSNRSIWYNKYIL